MGWLIRLGDWMQVDARQDCPVVTLSENAAIAPGAPHTSLESLARGVPGEEGVGYPLMVQRILRETVREVLGSADPEGAARTLLPPIRELFRASVEFGSNPGTEQAKRGC